MQVVVSAVALAATCFSIATPTVSEVLDALRREAASIQSVQATLSGSRDGAMWVIDLALHADGRFRFIQYNSQAGTEPPQDLRKPPDLKLGDHWTVQYYDGAALTMVTGVGSETRSELAQQKNTSDAQAAAAPAYFEQTALEANPLDLSPWMTMPWPVLDLLAARLRDDSQASVSAGGQDRLRAVFPTAGISLVFGPSLELRALERFTPGSDGSTYQSKFEYLSRQAVPGSRIALPSEIQRDFGDLGPRVKAAASSFRVQRLVVNDPDIESVLLFDPGVHEAVSYAKYHGVPERASRSEGVSQPMSSRRDASSTSAPGSAPTVAEPRLPVNRWSSPATWGWVLAGLSGVTLIAVLIRRGLTRG